MVNEKQPARKKPTPRSQAFKLRKSLGDAIPPTSKSDNSDKSHPHCFNTLSALLQSGLMLSKTTKSPLTFIFQSAMDLMVDCSKAYQALPEQISDLELKNAEMKKQLEDLNSELDKTKTLLTTAQQQVESHRTQQELYAQVLHEKGRIIRKRARDNDVTPTPAQSAATISTLRAVLRHQDLRYEELQSSFVSSTDQLISSNEALLADYQRLIQRYRTLHQDYSSLQTLQQINRSAARLESQLERLSKSSRASTPAPSIASTPARYRTLAIEAAEAHYLDRYRMDVADDGSWPWNSD